MLHVFLHSPQKSYASQSVTSKRKYSSQEAYCETSKRERITEKRKKKKEKKRPIIQHVHTYFLSQLNQEVPSSKNNISPIYSLHIFQETSLQPGLVM